MAVYKERSFLTPWLRWLTVVLIGALLCFSVVSAVTWDRDPGELIPLLIAVIGGLAGMAIAMMVRLDLRITSDSIQWRLFPLEWKTREVRVSEIATMEIKRLPRFPSYGGFGRRWKPWKKEIAYIMNRKHALFIELKDGRKRVYTTEQELKLRRFLDVNHPQLVK